MVQRSVTVPRSLTGGTPDNYTKLMNNADVQQFTTWARAANAYADAVGFAAPCDDFEYQFMLGFYRRGYAGSTAVHRLQSWRDQTAVSTEETGEREEPQ